MKLGIIAVLLALAAAPCAAQRVTAAAWHRGAVPPDGATPLATSGNGAQRSRVSSGMTQAAAEADPWFGPDKVKHFFASAALQSLGYGVLRAADVEHGAALAGASVATVAVGIGKELSDRRHGRRLSMRDMFWNAFGAAAMSLLLDRTER